jgi:hypothetical protein
MRLKVASRCLVFGASLPVARAISKAILMKNVRPAAMIKKAAN